MVTATYVLIAKLCRSLSEYEKSQKPNVSLLADIRFVLFCFDLIKSLKHRGTDFNLEAPNSKHPIILGVGCR